MAYHGTRGITLIEVTIVSALAMLVVLGMVGFYISSQSSWIAGSSQALAQRDATLLIEAISASTRVAALAEVDRSDSLHNTLILRDTAKEELWRFWWNERDQRIHQGLGVGDDRGPVVNTPVTHFQLDTLPRLLEIRLIEMRADDGQSLRVASAVALHNRQVTP